MSFSENYQNICRICLDENVVLNWNNTLFECYGVTYKDCYYKYTHLEYLADDPFSPMLCESCLNILQSIHTLVLTALESHKYFAEKWINFSEIKDLTNEENEMKYTPTEFETVLVEEIHSEPLKEQYVDGSPKENFTLESANFKRRKTILGKRTLKAEKGFIKECNIKEKDNDITLKIEHIKREEIKQSEYIVEELRPEKIEELTTDEEFILDVDNKRLREKTTVSDNESKVAENEPVQESETVNSKDSLLLLLSTANIEAGKRTKDKCNPKVDKNDNLATSGESKDNSTIIKSSIKKSVIQVGTKDKNNCSEEKSYICSICSKVFQKRYQVKRHEAKHNENRERKETCNICGLKFFDKANVYAHQKIHKEDREKRHKCDFCNKAFYNSGARNIHRRVHLNQMVPCTLCPKQFFRQIDLKRHMNSHAAKTINSDVTKATKYYVRCKYCDKSIRSTTFKSHTAAHLKAPLMKCSICDREYFNRSSCVLHMKRKHKKTLENYNDFIVLYTKNRISHLFLEQTADIELTENEKESGK